MDYQIDEKDKVEVYGWAKAVDRFFYTLFHMVTYFVTSLSDHALTMVSKSIVLIVPVPNAISVYYLSQTHMGFGSWQALAMAGGIEVVVFFMVGISLYLLGGWLLYGGKWLIPLILVSGATVAVIAVVIRYVYYLESISDGHTILAWLPALSIGAFIALGVEQWHNRQVEVVREQAANSKVVRTPRHLLTKEPKTQTAKTQHNNALLPQKTQHNNALLQPAITHSNGLNNAPQTATPSVELRSATATEAVQENAPTRSKIESDILGWLAENSGPQKASAISEALKISKTTVTRYLPNLVQDGMVEETYVGNSYRYEFVGG